MRAASLPLVIVSLLLLGGTSGFAQGLENDRIGVFVFRSEETPRGTIVVPKLPPTTGRGLLNSSGSTYHYNAEEARLQVEQLVRELERIQSRRDMLEVVERRAQADVFLEVVAAEIEGYVYTQTGQPGQGG